MQPLPARRAKAPIVIATAVVLACVVWEGLRLLIPDKHPGSFAVSVVELPDGRIWYPAAASGRRSRLLRARLEPDEHGAPIAPDSRPLPVLIYFGGWPGTGIENRELIFGLVEAGFAVAARSYPPSNEPPMDFSSAAAYQDTVRRADVRVRMLARDASALLDELGKLNAGDPQGRFSGRLDLERVGIFGYSFGGAVAAEAALRDLRFRAVLNIDGWSFGDSAVDGVRQPYLFIGDDEEPPGEADLTAADPVKRYTARLNHEDYSRLLHNLEKHGGTFLVVSGTTHGSFVDRGRASRIREALGLPADGHRRAQQIARAYAGAFFRQALLGVPSALLQGPSAQYPEVRFRAWTVPQLASLCSASMNLSPGFL